MTLICVHGCWSIWIFSLIYALRTREASRRPSDLFSWERNLFSVKGKQCDLNKLCANQQRTGHCAPGPVLGDDLHAISGEILTRRNLSDPLRHCRARIFQLRATFSVGKEWGMQLLSDNAPRGFRWFDTLGISNHALLPSSSSCAYQNIGIKIGKFWSWGTRMKLFHLVVMNLQGLAHAQRHRENPLSVDLSNLKAALGFAVSQCLVAGESHFFSSRHHCVLV